MNDVIDIKLVETSAEIQGILDLQQQNLKKNLPQAVIESQGFVTVEHDFTILSLMNAAQPSVIAKDDQKVVGYCLAMLSQFREDIPTLLPLFEAIDQLSFNEKPLKEYSFVVMGQVCVSENYRSMGLFDKMYHKLKEDLSEKYELCITDIAANNTRSLRAHTRVGFQNLYDFYDETLHETWVIVLWDWRKAFA